MTRQPQYVLWLFCYCSLFDADVFSMVHSTCLLTFRENTDNVRLSLSAVRYISPYLWLGCDETATLERLTLVGDQAGEHCHIPVSDFLPLPSSNTEEIDIEGLAYGSHYLWFVGSHSLKRKRVQAEQAERDAVKRLRKIEYEANRYTLGRIPLVDGQLWPSCPHPDDPTVTLRAAQLQRKKWGNELTHRLQDDRHLGDFLKADIPGKDNGLDIEGLAVMGDRLLLGLRGPVLRGWAVLLEVQLDEDSPGQLRLKKLGDSKARYRKCFLDLGGLGIRDLCPRGDTLLILAGPTMVLTGSIHVFSLPLADVHADNPLLTPTRSLEIPFGDQCDRAEGITLLGDDQDLLVVYDAPAATRLQGTNSVLADRIRLDDSP